MFKLLPNIKPAKLTVGQTRNLVLHPVTILVYISQVLFFFLFFSGNRYSLQSTNEQFLLTAGWGGVYYAMFYLFMGQGMHWLVSRNIPMTGGYFLFYAVFAIVEAMFGHLLFHNDQPVTDFLWQVFSTLMAIVPAIIICSFYFESRMRNIFGYDPEVVPIWIPVRRNIDLLQALLPRSRRGKILKLQSANQYVEVTTENGTHDLRMTLKSLLEAVPKGEGIHLHRSIWLRRDQIKEFGYENGNPQVIDVHGEKIPVGRNKVTLVKQLLS